MPGESKLDSLILSAIVTRELSRFAITWLGGNLLQSATETAQEGARLGKRVLRKSGVFPYLDTESLVADRNRRDMAQADQEFGARRRGINSGDIELAHSIAFQHFMAGMHNDSSVPPEEHIQDTAFAMLGQRINPDVVENTVGMLAGWVQRATEAQTIKPFDYDPRDIPSLLPSMTHPPS